VPPTSVDLAAVEPWQRSLRESRARRKQTRRAARRRLRRRGVILVLSAAMTAGAAGALAAAGGGASAGSPVLSPGDQGPAVAALQQALHVPADGIYGPVTRRAVLTFQRTHGLSPATGEAGPRTLTALGLRLTAGASSVSPALERIAECESGGDPEAVSAGGRYRGKYQFDRATWQSLGGSGDPAAAPEEVQDRMAARLLQRSGSSAWPNCA
jgi:hypothetical protein